MKLQICAGLVVVAWATVTLTVVANPIDSKSNVNATPLENETAFFKQLSTDERLWLLNTSLILHLRSGKQVKTLDDGAKIVEDPLGPAPPKLYLKLVNGEIPASFQKLFIQWLKYELKYTDKDLEILSGGEEVCGEYLCSSLPGLGQTCCPFG